MSANDSTCTIDGCERSAYARGFCQKHYKRWYLKNKAKRCSVEGCDRPHDSHGFCTAHAHRFKRYGDPTAGREWMNGEPMEWLRKLVADPPDGCVFWPFAKRGPFGYGGVQGEYAHRMSLMLYTGESPDHLQAAHNCGNGHLGCVNPKCLRWATPEENHADKLIHGTSNRGERQGLSKLTEAEVMVIYEQAHAGRRQRDIAEEFGIAQSNVALIKSGKSWSWLTGHS